MPNEGLQFSLSLPDLIWTRGTPFQDGSVHRATRFGDGIFETVLINQNETVALDYHAERMQGGIEILGLDTGKQTAKDILRSASVTAAKELDGRPGRMRVQLSRAGEGAYLPKSDGVEIFMEIYPLSTSVWPEPQLANGLDLTIFHDIPLIYSILSGVKSCSALTYVLAARHAQSKGMDEALLRSADGGLAESGSSNLFIRHAATLVTPPLASGCLPGTLRRRVLENARKQGMEILERRVDLNDLKNAEEVFLTNAIRGIQPVRSIELLRFPKSERIFSQSIWAQLRP